jgi:osmotically-inducible protein OsmY
MKGLVDFMMLAIFGTAIFVMVSIPAPVFLATQTEQGDLWIKTALESVMEKDNHLSLNRIEVASVNGIVKLGGTVLTDDEKGLAEQIASEIPGVRGIENDIGVLPAVDPNSELEKEAKAVLIENPLLHIGELRVEARNGMVTLEGTVNQTREKHLAKRLVALLPNVHGVVNKIETLGRA